MKSLFEGVVVGSSVWEMPVQENGKEVVKSGKQYIVLLVDDFSKETGLPQEVEVARVNTSEWIKEIKSGTAVTFLGEFQKAFKDKPAKMRYADIKVKK